MAVVHSWRPRGRAVSDASSTVWRMTRRRRTPRPTSPLEPTQPPMRLRTPCDTVVAVPYLVGFRPEASLVALVLAAGSHRVLLTMRLDLPEPGTPRHLLKRLARDLAALVGRIGGDTVHLLVYPRAPDHPCAHDLALPHRDLLAVLGEVLGTHDVAVSEALCVTRDEDTDRFWSYLCADARCCPVEGRVVGEADSLELRAGFVELGVAVRGTRAELVDSLAAAPGDDPVSGVLRAAVDSRLADWDLPVTGPGAMVKCAAAARRLDAMLSGAAGEVPYRALSTDELADLAAGLGADLSLRDVLLGEATRTDRLPALIEALTPAVRRLDGEPLAAVAATLAAAAYLAGHGALAWVAVDRALDALPTQSLAQLVASALSHALPPDALREVVCALPSVREWDGAIPLAPKAAPAPRTGRARAPRAPRPASRRAG